MWRRASPLRRSRASSTTKCSNFVASSPGIELDKFRDNPHFPVNTLMLMRGYVAAREAGVEAGYLEMGLEGLWEEGLKLDDREVLARRIDAAGLDSASLLAAAQTDRVKLKLADNTAAAVARGVFGVPTFFVGDEMFFGKERLGQVEEAVAGSP